MLSFTWVLRSTFSASLKRNRIKSVFSTVGILIKSNFNMKKRIAIVGSIFFVLTFSFPKDKVFGNSHSSQILLAELRPIPSAWKAFHQKRLFDKGLKYFSEGDYQGGIKVFSKFIRKYPNNDYVSDAYYNRGLAKQKIGDNNEAIADYTKVIEMDSSYRDAFINRSIVKELLGDIKGACLDARKSIDLGLQNEEYNNWTKRNCKRFK